MTEREALKLALEKFEFMNHVDSIFEGEFDFQINAIKKALAQPEQEPKCGAIIEVFGKDWRLEYLSLPVGKHKLYTQQYTYTTPSQRKPLTEDEVVKMDEWLVDQPFWRVLMLVRAIEAAHGIKE